MQIIKGARGRITGHFGDEDVPGAHVSRHLGTDIGHGDSTPADLRVGAPAAGTITFAGRRGTYGNCIIIDHGQGWTSLLAHLARILQGSGPVTQNSEVGVMGNTGGDWPVHLHQEIRHWGITEDAEAHLTDPAALNQNGLPPMTFDATDKDFLNRMGQSIKDDVIRSVNATPAKVWTEPLTHSSGIAGPASAWAMNTSDAIAALATETGKVEGLILALDQISGGGILDLPAITAAAEKGAGLALDKLTITLAHR